MTATKWSNRKTTVFHDILNKPPIISITLRLMLL